MSQFNRGDRVVFTEEHPRLGGVFCTVQCEVEGEGVVKVALSDVWIVKVEPRYLTRVKAGDLLKGNVK